MRIPGKNETLFIHPETNEFWYLPLKPTYGDEDARQAVIQVSLMSTFPMKEVQNEWTSASHQVLSSYTQADTTGGGQIQQIDEAVDGSRFWWATLPTMWPRQITLPRKAKYIELDGTVIPFGDYDDTVLFGSIVDTTYTLHSLDPVTDAKTDLDTFASRPTIMDGLDFQGTDADLRYFFGTADGYEIWDGIALSGTCTDFIPVAFEEWDGKIYAFAEDRTIYESLSGDTGSWTPEITIDGRYTPTGLITFFDRSDEPALHAICREAVFGLDLTNSKAYRTKIITGRHPSVYRPYTVFNTDLYIGNGMSAKKYTGGSIIPQGLDRDFGPPENFRGEFVSFASFEDGVVALVRGANTDGTAYPTIVSDWSRHAASVPTGNAPAALMLWNEDGWHTIWVGEDADLFPYNPTQLWMSGIPGFWRGYWGAANRLYWMPIDPYQFNPLNRGLDWEFEETGYIEYGELDFAMTGYKKLLAWVEIRSRDTTEDEEILVEVKIDGGEYEQLGFVRGPGSYGLTRLFLGENGTFPDTDTVRYDGRAGNSIQVKATLFREEGDENASRSPILMSMGVVFHKLMGTLMGYTMTMDGTHDEYGDKSTAQLHQFLLEMTGIGKLIPWWHQGEWKSVRFAGAAGWDQAGIDIKGDREIALLEVVDDL